MFAFKLILSFIGKKSMFFFFSVHSSKQCLSGLLSLYLKHATYLYHKSHNLFMMFISYPISICCLNLHQHFPFFGFINTHSVVTSVYWEGRPGGCTRVTVKGYCQVGNNIVRWQLGIIGFYLKLK